MSKISDNLLDAIQILANASVKQAGYDKTIQAQIVSCEDATIGKYKCKYQDAVFYAYSNNINTTYSKGAYVYILVPGNDMKKEKTILGTTEKLGINYIPQTVGDEAYNLIGSNGIQSKNIYYLDTNNKNYFYLIYESGKDSQVDLDVVSLEEYIKQSSSILLGATFKTNIPKEKQSRGHYGIIYQLVFKDSATGEETVKAYAIDEDNMIDNPYRLTYGTRQYQIFDINGEDFVRVESIGIFNKDFINAEGDITTGKLTEGDIEITDLEIFGAERLSEEELKGVAVTFYTPQGTLFREDDGLSNLTITAQVKVQGKPVSSFQTIAFYWGVENVSITPNSQYYNKHLGRGWKCINDYNIIDDGDEETNPIVEWNPASDTYIFKREQATAKNNKIKVAVIYDETVVMKEINIQNLSDNLPNITIESNSGTQFYYDMGHPTLTCKVNGEENLNYTYYWAVESTDSLDMLEETTELNDNYAAAVEDLNTLKNEIAQGEKFANAQAANLQQKEAAVAAFDKIQRIWRNKAYNVQIRNISKFAKFKCSVYNGDIYLGTGSIVLTNSLEDNNSYSLVIKNGAIAYKYNEDGVAPNSKSLESPQQIYALTFSLFDNAGNEIEDAAIGNTNTCTTVWAIPISNTLLIDSNDNGDDFEIRDGYKYYKNLTTFKYNIAQRYDIEKQNNQIQLFVDYKGNVLVAETQFAFSKEGEPGTNGTEFFVKLVPNTTMDVPPAFPMITTVKNGNCILNYGIRSAASEQVIQVNNSGYQLFKAQLWHGGELVWEGFNSQSSTIDSTIQPNSVEWSVLANKYNVDHIDSSVFQVTDSENGYIKFLGDSLYNNYTSPRANIIKCSITIDYKTYYGTIPITTAWVDHEKYRVGLRDYTGFRYVIYSSDGMSPKYDNSHSFEFICQEKIEETGTQEDVSLVAGEHAITYVPSYCGGILQPNGSSWQQVNSNNLELLNNDIYREGLNKNQWQYRPSSKYSGECVNNAILCQFKQNGQVIGKINVPVHFLLNRYGLANLNAWDGNSIQIDKEGGYILAPQMGAGKKEQDNSFTGVVMGEVKAAGKAFSNTGLFGYKGGVRTFFLNSENGSALLGKKGNGQIVIDPSQDNKALIYSGGFWRNYDEITGLPSSYQSGNETKQGLLIDLTNEPEIRYGNEKFKVDKNGILTATEANISGKITAGSDSKIGPWFISSTAIYKGSPSHGASGQGNMYFGNDGLSISNKFKIDKDGNLTATGANITGAITATTLTATNSGTIANWTINSSSLYYGNSNFKNANGMYFGTSGLSIKDKFYVDSSGNLTATGANISGTITATSGAIANFKINKIGDSIKFYCGDLSYGLDEEDKPYYWLSQGGIVLSATHYMRMNVADLMVDNVKFAVGKNFAISKNGNIYGNSLIVNSISRLDPFDENASLNIFSNINNKGHNIYTNYIQAQGNINNQGYNIYTNSIEATYLSVNGNINNENFTLWTKEVRAHNENSNDSTCRIETYNNNNCAEVRVTTNAGLYHDNHRGYGTAGWLIYMGTNGAIHVNTTSDRRQKKNINNMTASEANILLSNITPVNFNYIDDDNNLPQCGFIAQQVRDVLIKNNIGHQSYMLIYDKETQDSIDDLNEPEENVTYGLDYAKFVPVLWKGWQILNDKLNNLQEKYDKLLNELRS